MTPSSPDSADRHSIGRGTLEVWDQRYELAALWAPYVLLVAGTAAAVVSSDEFEARPVRILASAALAGTWVAVAHTRPVMAGRREQGPMRWYFAGLLVVSALAMTQHPALLVFAITGFFHAYLLRPWPVIVLAVTATSLVVNAPMLGRPEPDAANLGGYVFIVAIQAAAISLGIVGGEKLSEVAEERRQTVAELEATLAENAGLHAQLVAQAREAGIVDERHRLAREIHDTVAQGLIGVITQLEAAGRTDITDDEHARRIRNAVDLARSSLGDARRAVDALGPRTLDHATLPAAIDSVARSWMALHDSEVSVTVTGEVRSLDPAVEEALLRITQEALSNVARHARASRVGVTLSYLGGEVAVDVRDDGIGFDCHRAANGQSGRYGLVSMRQRLEAVSGRLELESEHGAGTAVSAVVPLSPSGVNP